MNVSPALSYTPNDIFNNNEKINDETAQKIISLLQANKDILISNSEYFKLFFKHKSKFTVPPNDYEAYLILINHLISTDPTKKLPTLNKDNLIKSLILTSMWLQDDLLEQLCDQCVIDRDNFCDFYEIANGNHIKKLKEKTLNFLESNLNHEDLPAIYMFSRENKLIDIQQKCEEFVTSQLSTYIDILDKDKFILAILENLSQPIPEKFLINLSSKQLLLLFDLIPEKLEFLNLSVYDDYEIAKLIKKIPLYVRELNLSNTALSEDSIDTIVSRCKLLEKLNLAKAIKWNEKDPFKGFEVIWDDLAGLSHLKSLNITDCPAAFPYLPSIILQSPELEELKVGNYLCGRDQEEDRGANHIDHCLSLLSKYCSKLRILDVSRTNLRMKGLEALFSNPKIRENLTTLSLSHCESLSNEDPESQFGNLSIPNLKSLDLSFTNTNIKDISIRQFLSKISNLEKLVLRNCTQIEDETIEILSKLHPQLKFLNLSNCNKITDKSIGFIKKFHSLQSLNISETSTTYDGFKKLLKNKHSNLSELSLHYPLNNEKLKAISQRWNQLKKLSIYSPFEDLNKEGLTQLTQLEKLRWVTRNPDDFTIISEFCTKITSLNFIQGSPFKNIDHSRLANFKDLKKLCLSAGLNADLCKGFTLPPSLEVFQLTTNFLDPLLIEKIFDLPVNLKKLIIKTLKSKVGINKNTLENLSKLKMLSHLEIQHRLPEQEEIYKLLHQIPRLRTFYITGLGLPLHTCQFSRFQDKNLMCKIFTLRNQRHQQHLENFQEQYKDTSVYEKN